MGVPWKVGLAIGAMVVVSMSCQEAPTAPRGDPGRPSFLHEGPPPNWYQYCRMWPDGAALVNQGGWWEGTCATSPTSTPNPPRIFGTNPQTVTLNFPGPVLWAQVSIFNVAWCPQTAMTWTAYNGINIVQQGTITHWACGDTTDVTLDRVDITPHITATFNKLVFTSPLPIPPGYAAAPYGVYFIIDYFIPCPPTGDSLLDRPEMRQLLRDSWAATNSTDPIPANRRERGGMLFRDPSTGVYTPVTDFDPEDTPCESVIIPESTPGEAVAHVHMHPFTDGESTTGACAPTVPGQTRTYDAKKYLGPSRNDILAAQNDGYDFPYYVMDKDNIYVIPPGTTLQNFRSMIKKYPRTGPGTCVIA